MFPQPYDPIHFSQSTAPRASQGPSDGPAPLHLPQVPPHTVGVVGNGEQTVAEEPSAAESPSWLLPFCPIHHRARGIVQLLCVPAADTRLPVCEF